MSFGCLKGKLKISDFIFKYRGYLISYFNTSRSLLLEEIVFKVCTCWSKHSIKHYNQARRHVSRNYCKLDLELEVVMKQATCIHLKPRYTLHVKLGCVKLYSIVLIGEVDALFVLFGFGYIICCLSIKNRKVQDLLFGTKTQQFNYMF